MEWLRPCAVMVGYDEAAAGPMVTFPSLAAPCAGLLTTYMKTAPSMVSWGCWGLGWGRGVAQRMILLVHASRGEVLRVTSA